MKKVKRLAAWMILVFVVTAASLTAMAAKKAGEYVPVYGEKYVQQNGSWIPVGSVSASYKKDGKCTGFSSTDSKGLQRGERYTWKGDYITKLVCDYRDSGTLKYTYNKKHKLVSRTRGLTKYTYRWSGKSAIYSDGNYTEKLAFNKKGQLTKAVYGTSAYTFSYYKNGNLKKSSSSFAVTNYNSRGDLKSFSYSYLNMNAVFTYVKDEAGRIKQVNVAYTDRNGAHNAKIVYSKWKKVSRVRNCDAAGTTARGSMVTDLLTLGSLFR